MAALGFSLVALDQRALARSPVVTRARCAGCVALMPLQAMPCRRNRGTVRQAAAMRSSNGMAAEPDGAAKRLREIADELRIADSLEGVNLYLVGLMGSGKSTVASLLGPAIGYAALDADAIIERAAGASIAEIFAAEGEEAFRELETQVLGELAGFGRSVVATGGGAVLRPRNWGHLHTGVTIWLDGSVDLLARRLLQDPKTPTQRPLLLGGATGGAAAADPHAATVAKLEAMHAARKGLYAQSDLTVSLEGAEAEEVTARALRALGKRLSDAKGLRAAEAITNSERFSQAMEQKQRAEALRGNGGAGASAAAHLGFGKPKEKE